ncbi:hypothetical protein COCSUDRAFT_32492 [Coccomyxa subellipsoidea C-169]|uniref:Uncharacterized protein n=1 Tax=Coccomyxa subellipsoidea (strain C-169) TaxID=574566 RepID=I0Z652_COCSC|nr:hypothetical protein COCSUDRAFT_32492 [Coccomyxa subellipsoidea C-169]EIE26121.1 hypothetical protein COCSUDRAFT_32492 [Coccomyxa subellipsoidea C-169]|eukprot:XP_005650665.1 hypothetical protein COCSUDRAFT_32492 [Coccomyxa subellipsoidea C-169]
MATLNGVLFDILLCSLTEPQICLFYWTLFLLANIFKELAALVDTASTGFSSTELDGRRRSAIGTKAEFANDKQMWKRLRC